MLTLRGSRTEVQIGPGLPTVLINDQPRIMDQSPRVLEELKAGDFSTLLELGRAGQQAGMDMVDILISHPQVDEVDLLPRIAAAMDAELGCPISLDSRNPAAIEAALQVLQPGKVLIDSVSAEPEVLQSLLPLAVRYGAAVVGMPIGPPHGLPRTARGRLEEARIIVEAAEACGIPRDDIMMDAILLAPAAEPGSFEVTLETLRLIHEELGCAASLGIGNAGFGMPAPTVLDLAYMLGCMPAGLDAAYVNYTTSGIVQTVRAMDFLTGRDPGGKRYIRGYREGK